jgi:DNA/RNA-binding domain of Phe-tRNA-synthetase-like protein
VTPGTRVRFRGALEGNAPVAEGRVVRRDDDGALVVWWDVLQGATRECDDELEEVAS